MAIKKSMQELYDLLVANKNEVISDILESTLVPAMSTKARGASKGESVRTSLRDIDGNVVAILDYYYKRWMPLVGDEAVEFGKKASSNTGYNSMCKEGLAAWTKQQREAKEATAQILVDVEKGTLATDDIADRRAEIEEARKAIQPTDLGFETLDEVVAYLEAEGVELPEADAE